MGLTPCKRFSQNITQILCTNTKTRFGRGCLSPPGLTVAHGYHALLPEINNAPLYYYQYLLHSHHQQLISTDRPLHSHTTTDISLLLRRDATAFPTPAIEYHTTVSFCL